MEGGEVVQHPSFRCCCGVMQCDAMPHGLPQNLEDITQKVKPLHSRDSAFQRKWNTLIFDTIYVVVILGLSPAICLSSTDPYMHTSAHNLAICICRFIGPSKGSTFTASRPSAKNVPNAWLSSFPIPFDISFHYQKSIMLEHSRITNEQP